VVTFPAQLGNVEYMVADDQHVSGVRAGVAVYPLVNVTMTADQADIGGHFALTLGNERTVSLSWDATDGAVLNAVQNLTQISKVAMVGLRDYETAATVALDITASIGATSIVTVASNVSTRISVGDSILFQGYSDTAVGRFVSGIDLVSAGQSDLYLSESVTFTSAGVLSAYVGSMKYSKTALPGKASLPSNFTLSGIVLYVSRPWVGLVFAGSKIWINEFELTVLSTPQTGDATVLCSAVYVEPFEGATAFKWGFGFERAIVIKSATTQVRNFRALAMSDLMGTNLLVRSDHTDGVRPKSLLLGSLSAIQTVTFRADNLTSSQTNMLSATPFQLVLGQETGTSVNLTYGSAASEWEDVLQSLTNVDRVSVSRKGDGLSAIYSYGELDYSVPYSCSCYRLMYALQVSSTPSSSGVCMASNLLHRSRSSQVSPA
jgi:hypothetical protein